MKNRGPGRFFCGGWKVLGAYVHKTIRISLSAALVSARLSGSAEAAYQPEDFVRIETLIEDGNWVGLRTFLANNPRVLDCNDPLAGELRRFLDDASGLYAALTFQDSMFPNMGLRDTIPDDCLIVADAPEATEPRRERPVPAPQAPVTSRAATPRETEVTRPAGEPRQAASAAPTSIY